jgi:hypothetical protein
VTALPQCHCPRVKGDDDRRPSASIRAVAYEWVAPTATAVTGVAGVFFTWLGGRTNARTQRDLLTAGHAHERDTALRLEKRAAFAALLGALAQCDRVLTEQGPVASRLRFEIQKRLGAEDRQVAKEDLVRAATPKELRAITDAGNELVAALREYLDRLHEVQLVGSDAVGRAADAVRRDLLDITEELAQFGEWRFVERELRAPLVAAMRVDLGYATDE